MSSSEPRIPTVDLPRVSAAQFQFYDHNVGAFLVTEEAALRRWVDEFTSRPPSTVAVDCETRGLEVARFTVTATTVAFRLGGDLVALLFNPLRDQEHRKLLTRVIDHAESVVFHNSVYDVPVLYAHQIMTKKHIRRVCDTLIAARMINTGTEGGRRLEDLSRRYGIMSDDLVKINDVFTARGCGSKDGWLLTDIDCPTYVVGALSDTVAALRLWGTPGVTGHGIAAEAARYLTSPDLGYGGIGVLVSPAEAERLVENAQLTNRIILERVSRGYRIDRDYPEKFRAENEAEVDAAARILADARIRPGHGGDLMKVLAERGEINPETWPKTPTGALSSDKKVLEDFQKDADRVSPLVAAHRTYAKSQKIYNYLVKVEELSRATGRVHPEVHTLGAQKSGRMSVGNPEIQQFPDEARGVFITDSEDWISCDWKSIEPVVLAHSSGDNDFITDMRNGDDPYEPVGAAAGITRKKAKILMLADLYGQSAASAAFSNGWTLDQAKQIIRTIRQNLPILYKLVWALKDQSEQQGHVTTLTGRVLDQRLVVGGEVVKHIAYRGPNSFCQGSAYDILQHAIIELDRRGLSDHIHMWMHDEIIADVSIQEELEEVMRTPPPFLAAVAETQHVDPFLVVDTDVMGPRWITPE